MRKKVLLLLFVFSLLLVTPVYVYGDNSNSTSTIKKQVDIGSFDVWKNSAGQWIASEPPKYNEHYRPVEADSLDSPLCNPHILPYVISAPADIAGSVVGVESITFITPNTAVNDYQDAVSATTIIEYINMYRDFQAKDIININSKYLGNGKVEVEYDTKLLGWIESWGEDKTKPWQGGQVSGHRFYMPILVTWKVANVPDFKVWIGSKDIGNKLPGEMITIDCSVKNLTGTLEKTDIGVAEYGSGWNPPTVHGPLVDIPIDGNNYNFSFQM
uniref:hypothetical protein n=1 Tax=Syntrophomonas wolfei TaxID=863 RepID=UPI000ACA27E0